MRMRHESLPTPGCGNPVPVRFERLSSVNNLFGNYS